jgi:hypothetical protein
MSKDKCVQFVLKTHTRKNKKHYCATMFFVYHVSTNGRKQEKTHAHYAVRHTGLFK